MSVPEAKQLTYSQAMEWSRSQSLRLAEVPVEHAVSIPLPTRRQGVEGYLQTASPAVRRPGEPARQSPPDRWWLFDSRGGRLVIYALTRALPLDRPEAFVAAELRAPADTVSALREARASFAVAMDAAAPRFFAGETPAAGEGAEIVARLKAFTPEPLVGQYRALAPDFFAWLGA